MTSSLPAGRSGKLRTPSGPVALFDAVIIVDWSARSSASSKRPNKDAIWWAVARNGQVSEPVYARTRAQAEVAIDAAIRALLDAGCRVLVGFDFPFGYPAGVARAVSGSADAMSLWRWIDARIRDDGNNANNRFEVASEFNRCFDGTGPMWGRPEVPDRVDVPVTATERSGNLPPDNRIVETRVPKAKTVWQMAYAGSVGSQILTGLPVVSRLRRSFGARARIWPMETGLQVPAADVVFAEIYPSLLSAEVKSAKVDGEVLDAAQVRITALATHKLDRRGGLAAAFKGVPDITPAQRQAIETEEGWILGAGHEAELSAALTPVPEVQELRYERDPAAIYRQSFATVQREARLDRFPQDVVPLIVRLIHACGMTEIADRIAFSPSVAASGRAGLSSSGTVLCDCEMVRSGIIARNLPKDTNVIATLNDPRVAQMAGDLGTTRSAAAVDLWRDHIEGAVVAVGNAPTALFRLLEHLDAGWPKPAAILAFPVGFVGAAESKAALAAHPRGCEFITLKGRKGGSAMASAAVNALAAGLEGHG